MIGGAQLGMNYGIANHHGQVSELEVIKILNLAHSKQILTIDTASQYGTSENILGKFAQADFKIITKLSPLEPGITDVKNHIKNQCLLSLLRLQRNACEGLLVHHANDLLGSQGEWVYEALSELKTTNHVKKIGVSVYAPEQVDELMNRFKLDIIQFPLNILDQRFLKNHLLQELKQNGIELHARSIFLQGLLLMKPDAIRDYFKPIQPLLITLHQECQDKGLTINQALIEFVTSINEIDQYIFGIDNHQHLIEIIDSISTCKDNRRIQSEKYACNDLNMINPMNWNAV